MSIFKYADIILFTALLLVVSGCKKPPEKPKVSPVALVVTAVATHQDVPVMIKAIGNMEASESVSIRSQISGELIKVAFREGQEVQKGALLFQFDSRSYQAALAKAEASQARNRTIMNNARRDYERYSQLVKEGIVTQEQAEGYRTKAEAAAADLAADQAAVESARTQLSYCTITSPISGRLGALMVDKGNIVKANDMVLVSINKFVPIIASFTIPEKELHAVKQKLSAGKMPVTVGIPGNDGAKGSGVVNFIDNAVDSATGTVRIKAAFDNSKKLLWPGQFVTLSLTLDVLDNAVVVPGQAVQTGQKGQFIIVVTKDGIAEIRQVVTGPETQGLTVIKTGLRAGEQVVVDGHMRVVPGGKVEVKGAKGEGQGVKGEGQGVKGEGQGSRVKGLLATTSG